LSKAQRHEDAADTLGRSLGRLLHACRLVEREGGRVLVGHQEGKPAPIGDSDKEWADYAERYEPAQEDRHEAARKYAQKQYRGHAERGGSEEALDYSRQMMSPPGHHPVRFTGDGSY
jgi:hypothetical protein